MGKYTIIEAPTFTVESTEPYNVDFKLTANLDYTGFNNNLLILDFGTLKRVGKTFTNIKFKSKLNSDDFQIIAVSAKCGCTKPTFTKLEDGGYIVNIGLDLTMMGKGDNAKFVTISLKNKKEIKIKLEVHGL